MKVTNEWRDGLKYIPAEISEMRFVIQAVSAERTDDPVCMIRVEAAGIVDGWDDDAATIMIDPSETIFFRMDEEIPDQRFPGALPGPIRTMIEFVVPMDRFDEIRAAEYIWLKLSGRE